jgi:hypothetical protein
MQKIAAIGESSQHYVGCRFPHYHLVSSDQSDDSVRVLLHKLNELGIDDDGVSIEPCEFNHRFACLPKMLSAVGGKSLRQFLNKLIYSAANEARA